MTRSSPLRRLGLLATTLLALFLGYDLIWHLVNDVRIPQLRAAAGVVAVVALVVALGLRRDAGPRWPLRGLLLVCVAILATDLGRSLLRELSASTTAAMMDLEPRGQGIDWGTVVLLVVALVAFVGTWPRRGPRPVAA